MRIASIALSKTFFLCSKTACNIQAYVGLRKIFFHLWHGFLCEFIIITIIIVIISISIIIIIIIITIIIITTVNKNKFYFAYPMFIFFLRKLSGFFLRKFSSLNH